MKTKTYIVKESGFVAVYVNARNEKEAKMNYMKKHGWYGGTLSIIQNRTKLNLARKINKYPARNLAKRK